MGEVIAFYCSPRENGYSAQLIEKVIAGAVSSGANIIRYNLNEKEIKDCQGCM